MTLSTPSGGPHPSTTSFTRALSCFSSFAARICRAALCSREVADFEGGSLACDNERIEVVGLVGFEAVGVIDLDFFGSVGWVDGSARREVKVEPKVSAVVGRLRSTNTTKQAYQQCPLTRTDL